MEYDRHEMNMSVRKSIAHLHHRFGSGSLTFFRLHTSMNVKQQRNYHPKKNPVLVVQGCVLPRNLYPRPSCPCCALWKTGETHDSYT